MASRRPVTETIDKAVAHCEYASQVLEEAEWDECGPMDFINMKTDLVAALDLIDELVI